MAFLVSSDDVGMQTRERLYADTTIYSFLLCCIQPSFMVLHILNL